MDKVYQHFLVEPKWQKTWLEKNIGSPSGSSQPYCIVVPPPNVTGTLHMGHGFQLTLMDVLVRYHRMSGYNTLWQVGTDHAGIATQMVVERQLSKAGKPDKKTMGREKFNAEIWRWKETSRQIITDQMKSLGTSMDWKRERFTLDDKYLVEVQAVFIQLFEEGLIYRGKKLVNWDPKLKTAVSDLEVLSEERNGCLWHIKYKLSDDSNTAIEIATTRPETLLGDQAVAVHPNDIRYQHLIGKLVDLPLTKRKIPIIADEYVDPDFGTGCVKITPAHDFNDYEVGKRHKLEMLSIMDESGCINNNAPLRYQKLDRFAAREKIISDLKSAGLLIKTEPHANVVPVGDRSGVILEPLLTNQWFLNCDDLAKQALEVVANGTIEFIPANWFNTYRHWLENIQDWCISRQLWWGHQIPAWYNDKGDCFVGKSEADVRDKFNIDASIKLHQDEDVLDTWFSSALWPFATLGEESMPTFYPTQVLVTGFDIIFFWVARMIMMGLKCTKQIPFKQVYITGLIKDEKGQKMSKSKGNTLDPLDLVNGISLDDLVKKRTMSLMQPDMAEKISKQTKKAFPEGIAPHGTDALRFTYCALASNGRDIRFDLNRLTGYRNFCNKLWNASRFVLSYEAKAIEENHLSEMDKYILSLLQICINSSHEHIKAYRFDLLAKNIYEFIWSEFCDKYLEWVKIDLGLKINSQAANVANYALQQILKLVHPIMPFITEEIWANISNRDCCLALEDYPKQQEPITYATKEIDDLFSIITGVRNLRSELNISPKKQLTLIIEKCERQDVLDKYTDTLAKHINIVFDNNKTKTLCTSLAANSMLFLVPLQGLVQPASEIDRISQVLKKHLKLQQQAESRLNNEKYCANAPIEQVQEYKTILENSSLAITKYESHLKLMQALIETGNE